MKCFVIFLLLISFEASAVSQQSLSNVKEIIGYKGTDITPDGKEGEQGEIVRNSLNRAKEFEFSKDEFNFAKDAQANPHKYVDWLSGDASQCKAEDAAVNVGEEHICNEFNEASAQSCTAIQKVEVMPKYKYECLKSINKFKKVCYKTLHIDFEEHDDCFNGQIKHVSGGSVSISYPMMKVNSSYGSFNGPWSSLNPNAGYHSEVVIDIHDTAQLSNIILIDAKYHPFTQISINGNIILGSLPQKCSVFSTVGIATHSMPGIIMNGICAPFSSAISFNKTINQTLNQQLTAALKPGRNVIKFHSFANEISSLNFLLKTKCRHEKDVWVEKCEEAK